jgi:hypothetical protein
VAIYSRANAGNPAPPDGRGYYGVCWASENPEKMNGHGENGKSAAAGEPRTNLLSFCDLSILRALEESAGYFDFPGEMKP